MAITWAHSGINGSLALRLLCSGLTSVRDDSALTKIVSPPRTSKNKFNLFYHWPFISGYMCLGTPSFDISKTLRGGRIRTVFRIMFRNRRVVRLQRFRIKSLYARCGTKTNLSFGFSHFTHLLLIYRAEPDIRAYIRLEKSSIVFFLKVRNDNINVFE